MFDRTKTLTKEIWWFIVLSGVAGIIFGATALLWPAITLEILIFLFAIFVIVGGAVALFESVVNIKKDRLWWLTLLFAILNMGIGVFLLRNPEQAATLFVILLAVAIFAQALFDLVLASYADKDERKWLWVFTGLLGLIAGVVIVLYPVAASVAFVWVLGLYTLVHGVIAIGYAIQIRREIEHVRDDVKKAVKK